MIRIITISREYGSGGALVGGILARKLGWNLVDDPVIAEIAKRANVRPDLAARYDECVDPWFHRLLKAIWRGGYEGVATDLGTNLFDADAMAALWHRVIQEAAKIGHCVIVGRGGQCILRDRRDAFHVSVYAPLTEKIARLHEMLQPGPADPAALIEEVDNRRAAYVRRHFGEEWTDRHLYNLLISSTIGLEPAADAILCAAGLKAKSPERSRTNVPGEP